LIINTDDVVVVDTHWHDDHVNGNQVYAERWPGVEFIAQTCTREDILSQAIGERGQGTVSRGRTRVARAPTGRAGGAAVRWR